MGSSRIITVGIMDQRLGQTNTLLVAAREPLNQLRALIDDIGFFERLADARRPLVRGNVFDSQDEIEIGLDGHIRVNGRRLWQIANVPAHLHRISEDIESGDAGRPGCSGHISGEDAHGGGFAGSVGAKETENFALIYCEGNVVNCCDVSRRTWSDFVLLSMRPSIIMMTTILVRMPSREKRWRSADSQTDLYTKNFVKGEMQMKIW